MKTNTNRIFTGTAGVYYVMYQLAARGFHASSWSFRWVTKRLNSTDSE